MVRKDFSVKSNSDGLELKVVLFVPDSEPKYLMQISHGMAEHKERYFHFMEHLTAQGFAVAIHDHRGHGESILCPEDLGYFYDQNGFAIVEDLHQITLSLKEMFPTIPIILFGHSMGSLVARNYVKGHDSDIDKLIICGAPGKNPLTGVALILVSFLKMIYGERHRSTFLQNMAFGSYNKQVGQEDLDNAWLCCNTEMVKKYNEDNLCGYTFTLNGFRNLFMLLKSTYSKKGWKLNNKDLPILFVAGECDPVILGEKSWIQAQEFMRQTGYKSVDGILYKDMRHEILNEKSRHLVYSDIERWIKGKPTSEQ
ncbi:MAG: alpha/beta fold hydrolase [Spirochaetaceae bacterium]|nr:alpha/beta fold hydrolase [Spirochaetaceae bacterium]